MINHYIAILKTNIKIVLQKIVVELLVQTHISIVAIWSSIT